MLVRNVFQLKFGKFGEVLTRWKEGVGYLKKEGADSTCLLVDLTAPFYTLVLENTGPNLAEFERFHKKAEANPDWKKWSEKFSSLVESGHREIFTVVE